MVGVGVFGATGVQTSSDSVAWAAFVPVVVFVGFAAVVGFSVWNYFRRQQRLRVRMLAIASQHGLQVDTATKKPPDLGFDLFGRGGSKKVDAQMWRAGEQDSVFQYQYTVGSGDNSRTYKMTAALVALPFVAPHLTISTETFWSKAKRAVGVRDIEVESPEFNDRYQVRCDDDRFAISLLDQEMIAWMLSPNSGGGTVTFEFGGSWMLCHCDQIELELLPGTLVWAQSVRARLPGVLTEWYGGTP
jgi:hypothetical protein